ncbi:phage tail assembly chaperone [Pseudomonas sp. L5B5]|uniref:phage tail assembly chaperone n=1 Tax=Pseudomonas sp. L5B5 TaxID=2883205 RepID=UPI001CFAB0AA|nr:phage tail assembly chaperone [Pseudomonas sp. L5B5]UCZ87130.1 phage tail assembly chaperone [Pseudomonas sp. L5B5]
MARYARVEGGVVVELIETGDYAITDLFAPQFLASIHPVPPGREVQVGMELQASPVPASAAEATEPVVEPLLTLPGEKLETMARAHVAEVVAQGAEARERQWRSDSLEGSQWLAARHRDEQDLGRGTSLSAQQYLQLLEYRQALREWPDAQGFPAVAARPQAPDWLPAP